MDTKREEQKYGDLIEWKKNPEGFAASLAFLSIFLFIYFRNTSLALVCTTLGLVCLAIFCNHMLILIRDLNERLRNLEDQLAQKSS